MDFRENEASSDPTINGYDSGNAPFKHDRNRSRWISTNDFSLACIGHCFGLRNFYTLATYFKTEGSIIMLFPYIATLVLFIIPIFFIQASVGQFASTGYISTFRVSPIFKGVGYVILLFNFTSVTYYSAMASYPLLLFFKSFTWDLPWMSCRNSWNTPNCTQSSNHTYDHLHRFLLTSPSKEFFDNEVIRISNRNNPYELSWPIVGALFVIWMMAGGCLVNGIVTIGRILRYATVTALTILSILFIRICCMPRSSEYFIKFITPSMDALRSPDVWLASPIIGTMALGTGWGSVMTLASYNHFRTDVEKCSIVIPSVMSVIIFLSGIMVYFIGEFMKERNIFNLHTFNEYMFEFLWIGLPYFFGTMEAAQLWFALIFLMLFMCELSSVIVQTLSILTALNDEYVSLRPYKLCICIGLCTVLFLLSTFFASNTGVKLYSSLSISAAFTQMIICFIEIVMIVWIYGRKRFQRDIQFMLKRCFATWKFYIIRFITPTFVVCMAFVYFIVAFLRLHAYPLGILFTMITKIAPWTMIPGYAVYKVLTTTGSLRARLRKCLHPNDWYPADPREYQRYNELLGSSDASHQLVELNDHE